MKDDARRDHGVARRSAVRPRARCRFLLCWSVSLPLVVLLWERVSLERIDPLPLELDLPVPIEDEPADELLLCTPSFSAVSEFNVPVAERLLALWNDFSASLVFAPMRPSIGPGS